MIHPGWNKTLKTTSLCVKPSALKSLFGRRNLMRWAEVNLTVTCNDVWQPHRGTLVQGTRVNSCFWDGSLCTHTDSFTCPRTGNNAVWIRSHPTYCSVVCVDNCVGKIYGFLKFMLNYVTRGTVGNYFNYFESIFIWLNKNIFKWITNTSKNVGQHRQQ